MVGSPREYISRMIFPVKRETYSFESEDIPERFQGSGRLETDFVRLGSEKPDEFHTDLFESTEDGWREIERSMYINRKGGFDVAEDFEMEERRIGVPGSIELEFVSHETLNEMDYITTNQDVTGEESEVAKLENISAEEVPGELEFRSILEYGKAWGPKRGIPMVEGKVSTEELDEGYLVVYNLDGASFYDNTDIESQAEIALDMMGLDFETLFSGYTNGAPREPAESGNYPEL